jgi:hypothetical protein
MQIEIITKKIKGTHAKGNFIKTGKLINQARFHKFKINQISEYTNLSIPTLSNLSTISKRLTPKMVKYVEQKKLSFKALRDIVRIPEAFREMVVDAVVERNLTTRMISELKKRIVSDMEQRKPIELKELIDTLNDGHLKPTPKKNNILDPDRYIQYEPVDVIRSMDLLCNQMSGVDWYNLGEWQRLGLITKKRKLDRQLNYLSDILNDEPTMPKM